MPAMTSAAAEPATMTPRDTTASLLECVLYIVLEFRPGCERVQRRLPIRGFAHTLSSVRMPQFFGQGKPPVGIVFDSDMSAIDDALALALLYGVEGKNEGRVISISVSAPSLSAAAFCDAVARFYTPGFRGGSAAFGRPPMPIGLALGSQDAPSTPMVTSPLARKTPEGKPVYIHGIHKLNDTAEVPALIRNALTAQFDQNAVVLLAGPPTNLVQVLALSGAAGLISQKVQFLAIGAPGQDLKRDIAAARKLFAEWPTPVVVADEGIGSTLLFPGAGIESDFAWAPAHPIADAYRAYRPMPYDAPSWALVAALYAARPKENYFQLSEPGTIAVMDDGRLNFTPDAKGRHRRLMRDPAQDERIIKAWTELASSKPVVRQPRFRPPQNVAKPSAAPPAKKLP